MWLPTLDLSFPPHSLRRKWAPNDPESYSLKKMWLYIVGENLARRVISRHSVVYKIAVVKALDPLVLGIKKKPVQFSVADWLGWSLMRSLFVLCQVSTFKQLLPLLNRWTYLISLIYCCCCRCFLLPCNT